MKKMILNLNELNYLYEYVKDYLKPNVYFLLKGNLGSGKTTLVQFLLAKLGVTSKVTSPTFNIVNQYMTPNQLLINHMDAYRLNKNEDLRMYEEMFINGLNFIEWFENIDLQFAKFKYVKIEISNIDEQHEYLISLS